nr:hypothetical protein HNKKKWOX_HNKKKWOX_CDS_0008 [Microvirus sp.]
MMVNEAGNTIHRHRTGCVIGNIDISKKLVGHLRRHRKHTVHIRLVLANPRIRERRKLGVIIRKMPNIERLLVLRPHFAGNLRRLVTIIGPGFLITENLIILRAFSRASCIDFLVLNSLLTNIRKNRPVIIKLILTAPHTVQALLISMIITSDHQTDNKTMLRERLKEIGMSISSLRHANNSTLRRTSRFRTGLLHNLVYIDRHTVTAEILRTLKASIRRRHTEERAHNLSITRTATGLLFIKLLNLKSKTKLVNRSSLSITILNSIKINEGHRRSRRISLSSIKSSNTTKRTAIRIIQSILRNTYIRHTTIRSLLRLRINHSGNIRRCISRIQSLNRQICSLSNRNSHVRTFLRARKTTCEIIVIFASNVRKATFRHIRDKGASIHTSNGGIIERNNKRVLQILVTEPLIHNESIGPERKSIHRKTRDTGRNAEIVSDRTNLPTVSRRRNELGNIIFRLRNPGGFRILTTKLFPVIPNQTIWHEEIVSVQIHIIHHRSQQGLHTDNLRRLDLESIARKNFFQIEGNNVTNIKRRLHTSGTIKPGARNVNMGIKRKMRFRVTIHSALPPSGTDSRSETEAGAG